MTGAIIIVFWSGKNCVWQIDGPDSALECQGWKTLYLYAGVILGQK